jgi:hypothetical protein
LEREDVLVLVEMRVGVSYRSQESEETVKGIENLGVCDDETALRTTPIARVGRFVNVGEQHRDDNQQAEHKEDNSKDEGEGFQRS